MRLAKWTKYRNNESTIGSSLQGDEIIPLLAVVTIVFTVGIVPRYKIHVYLDPFYAKLILNVKWFMSIHNVSFKTSFSAYVATLITSNTNEKKTVISVFFVSKFKKISFKFFPP